MIFSIFVDIFRVIKVCNQYNGVQDQWISQPCKLSPRVFGRGSKRPFSWYLEGSSLKIENEEELLNTLTGRFFYKTDKELFKKKDYWQHPSEFEKRREGDCEDHALWAWRKLKEVGIPARFVGGCFLETDSKLRGHAWVTFERESKNYLLESCWKDKKIMVMPIDGEYSKQHYFPFFGIDVNGNTYAYAGLSMIVNKYGFKELKGLMV